MGLEQAQKHQHYDLNPSIDVDPPVGYCTQVLKVRLVLVGHKEELEALQELDTEERGEA